MKRIDDYDLPAWLLTPREPSAAKKSSSAMPAVKPLQIEAGLEEYTTPLSRPQVMHLMRRAGYGASPVQVGGFIGKTAGEIVDALIEEATNSDILPLPDMPEWYDQVPPPRTASQEEIDEFIANNNAWLEEVWLTWGQWLYRGGLREKMTLFWTNHFVTEVETYYLATFAIRYLDLMREYALGNFKDAVRAIGLTPSMLIYLNGNANRVGAPNENYGRELLELFTMGQLDKFGSENYNQGDIEEISRALTGWDVNYLANDTQFISVWHDNGSKTFFGRTGNFGYDDVIDIIFEERSIPTAYFICEKLYKEFIYEAPDANMVQELADLLIANDFEIAPVVAALLKSAHFYDGQLSGAQIKSPTSLIAGIIRDTEQPQHPFLDVLMFRGATVLGQYLLNPPNVAGWPGHHDWVSTSTLGVRWLAADYVLFAGNEDTALNLVPMAQSFSEPTDPFNVCIEMAEHLLGISLDQLDIGEIAEEFEGDLETFPIPDDILNGPAYVRDLAKIFLQGIPWYDWDINDPLANQLLLVYARYLMQIPEYQLT